MFDIYGIIDFNKKIDMESVSNPFLRYRLYDVDYQERVLQMPHAKFFCLERGHDTDNIYENATMCCFVFGFVFTNTQFQSLIGSKPHKLNAKNLLELYQNYSMELPKYLKGSFVVVIYDKKNNNCALISDQLNVLPVYHAFKNGMFLFSSAIKPLLVSGLVQAIVDPVALAEVALFDYTLGSRTLYEDINVLDQGTILTVQEKGASTTRYFAIDRLFNRERLDANESFGPLSTLMQDNLELHVSDHTRFLLSLTGGFDGRANLAMIKRPIADFLCYSYGMPGSRQIDIPQAIKRRLCINYHPILLNDEFEQQYEDCATRALFYSDGTAPILRANYTYAFRQLREFSDLAITGLFGSEVLRPARNLGIQVNKNSEKYFLSRDQDCALREIFQHEQERGYLQSDVFIESYGVIRDYLYQNYLAGNENFDPIVRFYMFYLGEGVRRYFMQEIRIERIFVTTRFPYWDYDLVDFLFRTPFAGLYNGAFRQSPIGRRRAQSLYARLIRKYRPVLGDVVTDRGYKPNDLLAPFFYLKVLPGYIRAKYKTRYVKNDTFDSEKWTDIIFSQHHNLMKKETDLFSGSMYTKYRQRDNISDNYYFSRMFSLKYWFENYI